MRLHLLLRQADKRSDSWWVTVPAGCVLSHAWQPALGSTVATGMCPASLLAAGASS